MWLRQSTASQTRLTPRFVDDTDFKTPETGLSIANTDVKLSKNGGASANKNSGGGSHIEAGRYALTFDATDTGTVGELAVGIVMSGALPVEFKFFVVEEAVYDAFYVAAAPGYVVDQPVNVTKVGGTSQTAGDIMADTNDIQTRLPAALVSGRMDSSVGAMANNVLTASAINADAITAAKVADGTIDAATFAAGAINAAAIAASAITAAKFATDAVDANALAANAVTEIQSGLATSASLATVQADTDDIQTRLPAALVAGRMDSSVGAMAANVLTAAAINAAAITNAKFAAGAIDAAAIAADAIGASELAADAVTEIVTAVFARAFSAAYGSFTFDQLTSMMSAALLAKCSGMGTATGTFRNLADSADVIVATIDANGNRTAVTRTP